MNGSSSGGGGGRGDEQEREKVNSIKRTSNLLGSQLDIFPLA